MLLTVHILLATCVYLASAGLGGNRIPTRDRWTTTTKPIPSRSGTSIPHLSTTTPSTSRSEYLTRARLSVAHLQGSYYDETTGLYDKLWWNSANALTTYADLVALDPSLKGLAKKTYSNTFKRAQEFNLQEPLSGNNTDPTSNPSGFLNDFYDDEGWWAWAWLKVYDQTHNPQYLNAAISIFQDQTRGFHASCGGLLWSKDKTYDSAIANELFLFTSASLATRVPASQKDVYLHWALREWDWFRSSGLINAQNLINDGLNASTCKNNGATVYTYNQGVILAGLVELHKATTNNTTPHTSSSNNSTNSNNATSPYLTTALTLAHASLSSSLTTPTTHILRDQCDPHCLGDAQQLKGPYMRGLQALQEVGPREEFRLFIEANADSVWQRAKGPEGDLGSSWVGPYDGLKSVQSQSAACDALVAAAAVGGV